MRGDWGVGLIEVAIDVWVAREGVRFRAVGEVVDVFRADEVDEFERGFAVNGLRCRRFGLNGRGNGCRTCIRCSRGVGWQWRGRRRRCIRNRRRGVGSGSGQGGDDAGAKGGDNNDADNENAGC